MSQDPQEMYRRIQRSIQSARQGGGPGRGTIAGGGGILLLLGGVYVLSQSIFNVDGGHRAIKYTRLGGVKKEIFPEGQSHCPLPPMAPLLPVSVLIYEDCRHPSPHPMARNSHRLRCPR